MNRKKPQIIFRNPQKFVYALFLSIFFLGALLIITGCAGGGSSESKSAVSPISSGGVSQRILTGKITTASVLQSSIRGLDASLLPVASAEVWLEENPEFMHSFTTATGVYQFLNVPPGEYHMVAKLFDNLSQKTYKNMSFKPVYVSDKESAIEVDPVQIVEAKNTVRGILLDPYGNPLPQGTKLSLWGENFFIRENGNFETPPLPDGFTEAELKIPSTSTSGKLNITIPFAPGETPSQIEINAPSFDSFVVPPTVSVVTSGDVASVSRKIRTQGQIFLFATPKSDDSSSIGKISISWVATKGELSVDPVNEFKAAWTAPETPGIATISIKVTDPHGAFSYTKIGFLVGIDSPNNAAANDTEPPIVTFKYPAENATGVPIGIGISVGFSEAIDSQSFTTQNFFLKTGEKLIPGRISLSKDGKNAVFQPENPLDNGATFSVYLSRNIKDLAGNTLQTTLFWTFSTVPLLSPTVARISFLKVPPLCTTLATAEFRIDGSFLLAYRFKLDSGSYSNEIPLTVPTYLSSLTEGIHTFFVLGKNSDEVWQSELTPASYSWLIDWTPPSIAISSPSISETESGPVNYSVTYSGADWIGLSKDKVSLEKTNSVNGVVEIKETGITTRTINIKDISGAGTFRISIASGTAFDAAGNMALGAISNDWVKVTPPLPTATPTFNVSTIIPENGGGFGNEANLANQIDSMLAKAPDKKVRIRFGNPPLPGSITLNISDDDSNPIIQADFEAQTDGVATEALFTMTSTGSTILEIFGVNPISQLSLRMQFTSADGKKSDSVLKAKATAPIVSYDPNPRWRFVGSAGFSDYLAFNQCLKFDGSGVLYVSYSEILAFNDARITVKKYNGKSWENVGNPRFSAGPSTELAMALGPGDTPFVAFSQNTAPGNYDGLTNVMKFNGASWETIGTSRFTDDGWNTTASGTNLVIAPNGNPVVSFASTDDYGDYWTSVVGFASTYGDWGSMAPWVDNGGWSQPFNYTVFRSMSIFGSIPYVLVQDFNIGNGLATVKKLVNGTWTDVGPESFSGGLIGSGSIQIDSDGTPYVAYSDYAYGFKAIVKKFDETNWVNLGSSSGISDTSADDLSLVIQGKTIFLAFTSQNKTTVLRWNNSSWESLGLVRFSPGQAYFLSMAAFNDIPYLAFMDYANGLKTTVMKYE
ncbi:MAG: Ig-like domain-containing protein [Candidatus Riflebacteria bacterium]|nr:Ig-like domain-containing protein [Candidatus Riflebacteria bacterium]